MQGGSFSWIGPFVIPPHGELDIVWPRLLLYSFQATSLEGVHSIFFAMSCLESRPVLVPFCWFWNLKNLFNMPTCRPTTAGGQLSRRWTVS
jgi:hypothetical protein